MKKALLFLLISFSVTNVFAKAKGYYLFTFNGTPKDVVKTYKRDYLRVRDEEKKELEGTDIKEIKLYANEPYELSNDKIILHDTLKTFKKKGIEISLQFVKKVGRFDTNHYYIWEARKTFKVDSFEIPVFFYGVADNNKKIKAQRKAIMEFMTSINITAYNPIDFHGVKNIKTEDEVYDFSIGLAKAFVQRDTTYVFERMPNEQDLDELLNIMLTLMGPGPKDEILEMKAQTRRLPLETYVNYFKKRNKENTPSADELNWEKAVIDCRNKYRIADDIKIKLYVPAKKGGYAKFRFNCIRTKRGLVYGEKIRFYSSDDTSPKYVFDKRTSKKNLFKLHTGNFIGKSFLDISKALSNDFYRIEKENNKANILLKDSSVIKVQLKDQKITKVTLTEKNGERYTLSKQRKISTENLSETEFYEYTIDQCLLGRVNWVKNNLDSVWLNKPEETQDTITSRRKRWGEGKKADAFEQLYSISRKSQRIKTSFGIDSTESEIVPGYQIQKRTKDTRVYFLTKKEKIKLNINLGETNNGKRTIRNIKLRKNAYKQNHFEGMDSLSYKKINFQGKLKDFIVANQDSIFKWKFWKQDGKKLYLYIVTSNHTTDKKYVYNIELKVNDNVPLFLRRLYSSREFEIKSVGKTTM